MNAQLAHHIDEAEAKAWDALRRYKFQMFGYWAAIWVHLNKIEGRKRPNPWRGVVRFARSSTQGAVSNLDETPIWETSQ